MGVRGRLAARAVRGTRVLLVGCPGWWVERAGVEREVRQRGWSLATSPADADALVVCGVPGQRLRAAVEAVWDQVPGPRAYEVAAGADPLAVLDRVEATLLDHEGQRADALGRRQRPPTPARARGGSGAGGIADGGEDEGTAPDGIGLADGFEGDRDGLEMDVLHVTLGPVLPAWPAGLALHATLSGDVLVEAEVEVLDEDADVRRDDEGRSRPVPPPHASLAAARGCDHAAPLLLLAGADDLALGLQRVRDDLLGGAGAADVDRALERLVRRTSRSRLLRWSLRGLGSVDHDAADRHHLPAGCRGDVHDRLLAVLEDAMAALRGRSGAEGADPAGASAGARAALPALVTGYELAAVRLVVASLPLAVGGLALADAP